MPGHRLAPSSSLSVHLFSTSLISSSLGFILFVFELLLKRINLLVLVLVVDGTHLARQGCQLFKVQVAECLAGYPRILAEGIDPVPVGGVNTILLQLVQSTRPQALLLRKPALFASRIYDTLQGLAHLHIFALGHLMQMLGTAPRPLAHQLALVAVCITSMMHLVKHGIKPSVVSHLSHFLTVLSLNK